jgi:outer membrane protein assembly factor BamA
MRFLIFTLILIFLTPVSHPLLADTASSSESGRPKAAPVEIQTDTIVYIRGIEIYGNVTTRPEVLKRFFAFDTGMALDTAKLRATRDNLMGTKLYDKVDIFPRVREDGALDVFVILKESVRLELRYGAGYSTHMYGQENLWFDFFLEAMQHNFMGRMEEFTIGATLWHYKALRLSWFKPFWPTPYFIAISAGIADYPSEVLPLDDTDVYARLTVGRNIGKHSRLGLSGIPMFRHRSVVESMMPDSGAAIPNPGITDFYEAFGALRFTHDQRSSRFDPQKGWHLLSEVRTNWLYAGINTPFVQAKGDIRYYLPLLFDDLAVLRLAVTARDTYADAYHRLTSGAAGEVRGFYVEELGWRFITNSSILASIKYHKPLYKSPTLPIPLVDLVFTGVKTLHFRLDGTLIADYARLYHEPLGAITFSGDRQEGIGLGFGGRIVVPEVRQSGCIDLVFGKDDRSERWGAVLHLYLDLFF